MQPVAPTQLASALQQLIQVAPNRPQVIVPVSPENEEKPSLITRIQSRIAVLRFLHPLTHTPKAERTPPRHYRPIRVSKNFFETRLGMNIEKIINELHRQGLFSGNSKTTKQRVAELLHSEGTGAGDVIAELVQCKTHPRPPQEQEQLITMMAAYEKLRRCAYLEVHEVKVKQRETQKEIDRVLAEGKAQVDRQCEMLRGQNDPMGLEALGKHFQRLAQVCNEKTKLLQSGKEEKARVEDGFSRFLEADIALESTYFPKELQIERLHYSILPKKDITQVSSFIAHEEPLHFRFLTLNENGSTKTPLSAYLDNTRSFIYIPQKGKFWFHKKSECYQEIQSLLNSYMGVGHQLELTVWKEKVLHEEPLAATTAGPRIEEVAEEPVPALPSHPATRPVIVMAPPPATPAMGFVPVAGMEQAADLGMGPFVPPIDPSAPPAPLPPAVQAPYAQNFTQT